MQKNNSVDPIVPLGRETSDLIRSAKALPSLSSFVVELVYNSIDAGADRIEIEMRLPPDHCPTAPVGLCVQDNGHGIHRTDLERYVGTTPGVSSKGSARHDVDRGWYGARGEALFGMACLCTAMHVTSRAEGNPHSYRKVIRSDHKGVTGGHDDDDDDGKGNGRESVSVSVGGSGKGRERSAQEAKWELRSTTIRCTDSSALRDSGTVTELVGVFGGREEKLGLAACQVRRRAFKASREWDQCCTFLKQIAMLHHHIEIIASALPVHDGYDTSAINNSSKSSSNSSSSTISSTQHFNNRHLHLLSQASVASRFTDVHGSVVLASMVLLNPSPNPDLDPDPDPDPNPI